MAPRQTRAKISASAKRSGSKKKSENSAPTSRAAKSKIEILPEGSNTQISADPSLISRRAWEIWQSEGCPEGRDVEHWLRAERELRSE